MTEICRLFNLMVLKKKRHRCHVPEIHQKKKWSSFSRNLKWGDQWFFEIYVIEITGLELDECTWGTGSEKISNQKSRKWAESIEDFYAIIAFQQISEEKYFQESFSSSKPQRIPN